MSGGVPKVLLRDGAAPGEDDGSPDVPRVRGSYKLLGELARGGVGIVLRGHDADLGRDAARGRWGAGPLLGQIAAIRTELQGRVSGVDILAFQHDFKPPEQGKKNGASSRVQADAKDNEAHAQPPLMK